MSARRGATGLRGVLLVDKPLGLTSHDVIARIRRATGEGRVGHAGTLDPMATGLLVVLVGPFTRLEPYLSVATKRYIASVAFGSETDTDDAEGCVRRTADVPGSVLDVGAACDSLTALVGPSLQKPPAFSAIKVGGRVAHRVARSGGTLEVAPRPIVVERADLVSITAHPPTWQVDLTVSKGTYVRAIARDLGRSMGTAAHLRALRRIAAGSLTLDASHSIDTVENAVAEGSLSALFADPVQVLGLPPLEADPAVVSAGRPIPSPPGSEERFAIVADGTLLAIYRRGDDDLVPEAVFPGTPEAPL